jgi:DNA replication protein DnaC
MMINGQTTSFQDMMMNSGIGERYKQHVSADPVKCTKCGELINYKGQKLCVECMRKVDLMGEYTKNIKEINSGTQYAGIDWEHLQAGENGTAIKQIKRIVSGRGHYNMLIHGVSKGVGKSTTGHVIKHHARVAGKTVEMVKQSVAQEEMTKHKDENYHVIQKYSNCELLIIDEICRGVMDSNHYGNKKYFRQCWFDIIDHRITYMKSTVLIGNVSGIQRTKDDLNTNHLYASDYFDYDRLKLFAPFEFAGNSHRGGF